MSNARDSFVDLDRHRVQLEQTIAQLQKAIQYWRGWDADYECLKEDLDELPEKPTQDHINELRNSFEADLMGPKDLDEVFGKKLRTRTQAKNVLDRRIDYVTQNIQTLEKQLETAEEKLARVQVVSQPEAVNEEGEVIMDIFEQLDDDDKVVSSHLESTNSRQAKIEAILKKAGIAKDGKDTKEPEKEAPVQPETTPMPIPPPIQPPGSTITPATGPRAIESSPMQSAPPGNDNIKPGAPTPKPILKKKGVSFTEDTKPADDDSKLATTLRVEQILKVGKEQEQLSQKPAMVPQDESAEESFLRQEMLKYGRQDLSELGAIVAEMTFDEKSIVNGSDDLTVNEDSDDDYEYEVGNYDDDDDGGAYNQHDEDDEGTDEEESDENEWGWSTKGVMNDDYLSRMNELQGRISVTPSSTTKNTLPIVPAAGIGRITVKSTDVAESPVQAPEPPQEPKPAKKVVKFAPELDIAPDTTPQPPPETKPPTKQKPPIFHNPVSERVMERPFTPSVPKLPSAPSLNTTPTHVSRFRQARAAQPASSATPPTNTPLADVVVERPVSANPKEPNQFDEAFLLKEAAVEHARIRASLLQRESGCVLGEEDMPAEQGEVFSTFKAARLSRQ